MSVTLPLDTSYEYRNDSNTPVEYRQHYIKPLTEQLMANTISNAHRDVVLGPRLVAAIGFAMSFG